MAQPHTFLFKIYSLGPGFEIKYITVSLRGEQSLPTYVRASRCDRAQTHKPGKILYKFVDWKSLKEEICSSALPKDVHVGNAEAFASTLQSREHTAKTTDQCSWSPTLLQNFRVIDLYERRVCRAPANCQYAALSYVWGAGNGTQFLAKRNNVRFLESPGSLDLVDLPCTIHDAGTVCVKLGVRYVWVDQLCIVQDEETEIKQGQINSMGEIYGTALFTIIASAGSDSRHGLPGVNRKPRAWKKAHLQLHDLKLLSQPPDLDVVLGESVWNSRAWTYQESALSNRLLYFTNFGTFYKCREGLHETLWSEWSQGSIKTPPDPKIEYYSSSLGKYSERRLSYAADFLRAFSGVLNTLYGAGTLFGLPLDDFDRAILWELPDRFPHLRVSSQGSNFPSWSWLSAERSVEYENPMDVVQSVACWAVNASTIREPSVRILKPKSRTKDIFAYRIEAYRNTVTFYRAIGAIAWLEGCVRSTPPPYLFLKSSKTDYDHQLEAKWPDYPAYWHDVFGAYNSDTLFSKSGVEALRVPGRILVHTQMAQFNLEFVSRPRSRFWWQNQHDFIIRSIHGRLVGSITLSSDKSEAFKSTQCRTAHFIALSTTTRTFLRNRLRGNISKDLSKTFGCWCSSDSVSAENKSRETSPSVPAMFHLDSCPQHPSFYSLDGRPKYLETDEDIAHWRHEQELAYRDLYGEPLHYDSYPIALNVMLISEKLPRTKIAHRVGIGFVYLKRWVEANPHFETVILE